jgi:hypothetical protein
VEPDSHFFTPWSRIHIFLLRGAGFTKFLKSGSNPAPRAHNPAIFKNSVKKISELVAINLQNYAKAKSNAIKSPRQVSVSVLDSLLPDVCQVRVDFVDFHLKPMTGGVCSQDNRLIADCVNNQ